MRFASPLIDEDNPFYCPGLSATTFLSQSGLQKQPNGGDVSFSARLSLSAQEFMAAYCTNDHMAETSSPPSPPTRKSSDAFMTFCRLKSDDLVQSSDRTFQKLDRTPNRARSSSSEEIHSFVLSAKAERLEFPDYSNCGSDTSGIIGADHDFTDDDNGNSCLLTQCLGDELPAYAEIYSADASNAAQLHEKLRSIEEQFYGPELGPQNPTGVAKFLRVLDFMIPELKIQNYFGNNGEMPSHQAIVNVLGARGELRPHVLELFRRSKIQNLNLSESVRDEEGLNLLGKNSLKILKKANSFRHVIEINLSNAPLEDLDLTALQGLSSLQKLYIANTQIGSEGIMHLVCLKQSLTVLDVAKNPRIDDDAIPALCLISRLGHISLQATGITMLGLRKYARTIPNNGRGILLEVPLICSDYLSKLQSYYSLRISPPLICEPSSCEILSNAALKKNLLAHAEFNSSINTEGTRTEMISRLKLILETRAQDILVRKLVQRGVPRT